MYRILIVEDDSTIASNVAAHLERWDYETKQIEDFKCVMEAFQQFDPQLVILDIGLPFYNGFYWCQEIRKISSVPILFLSSMNDNMNIVMAMNMGGDEFIEKPFDLNVLTAKVQALLRRAYSFQGNVNVLEHEGMLLNLNDASLSYKGEKISLTKNEFRILQMLMENAGKIVARDDIIARLWESDEFIDDNTLTVNVARLRKKLENAGMEGRIKTKKGIGYYLDKQRKEREMIKESIFSFLKIRKMPIIIFTGIVVIFGILFYLYDIPFDAIIYGCELSFVWCAVCLFIDFYKYYKRHKLLHINREQFFDDAEQLPEHMDIIEYDYQELAKELYQAKQELISKNRIAKKELLDYYGMWVHQIKTPIAALDILLQNTEQFLYEEDIVNSRINKRLEIIQESIPVSDMKMELFKIEQYVEMALNYLRVEDISSDLSFKQYAVDDMVCQVIRKYAKIFISKKIKMDFKPTKACIVTDEKWFIFVLEQIISNALKYIKKGQISIYMKEKSLVIEDTGIGIPAEDLPRIFEKGFTGYNGRENKKSTGIGLYLCKNIMDKLQWNITADSEVGRGTKIYLTKL